MLNNDRSMNTFNRATNKAAIPAALLTYHKDTKTDFEAALNLWFIILLSKFNKNRRKV